MTQRITSTCLCSPGLLAKNEQGAVRRVVSSEDDFYFGPVSPLIMCRQTSEIPSCLSAV